MLKNIRKGLISGVARNSTAASQPCSSGHITADKREIKDFPKLPLVTSFIRKPLGEIILRPIKAKNKKGVDKI
jgi:hypothetical protein